MELTSLFAGHMQSIRDRWHGAANHDIDKIQLSEILAIGKELGSLAKELSKCKRSIANFRRAR
jgi:hypothetical protein